MSSATTNGHTNGHSAKKAIQNILSGRFSHIPTVIDIPVGDGTEGVDLPLEDLSEDVNELCTLLETEQVAKDYWTTIAIAYVKESKLDSAIEVISRALSVTSRSNPQEKLSLYNALCWLYLSKARTAPRIRPDGKAYDDSIKTKDHYLRAATSTLNEATPINPSYPPFFLARGLLSLLRAALAQDARDKGEMLRQSAKAFTDALKISRGKDLMARLGHARTMYALGRFADALTDYQQILTSAPDLVDPDPRIGIGCCYWQLGYKDDARTAWARSLELQPDSKIANVLLGLYHLSNSSQYDTNDPTFATEYKKAMVTYTQAAFKSDNRLPLACSTFGNYFAVRKAWSNMEPLARKAIELTDVNAIASDGWFLLARKEHNQGDSLRAAEYYVKADQARGGDEKGYFPAKLGAAQLRVMQHDYDDAKFRLEKIVSHNKNIEAMSLLAALHADYAFHGEQRGATKEEQLSAARKAIQLLEAIRATWTDPKRKQTPNTSVLILLSRLYESDSPEKSLACLDQVEQIEIDDLPEEDKPELEDEAERKRAVRRHLPPQLLNNLGCFHYQANELSEARGYFQSGLDACVALSKSEEDNASDTDAFVTTISFNLGRTYEAENMLDEAKEVYEGLLKRHAEYVDARIRLTYIALRQSPTDEGPKAIVKLYEAESNNLEVRALYGWYLRKAKRRTNNIAEDQEQRHFKHTLQNHDKHDRYALTGMGNLYLATAREMRRETDSDKEKRHKMYERAIEFFDKALQLDPQNAYAAQGVAIAVVEDKKDHGAALQIFSKVRETIKDASIHINMGHTYCEVKQYSRAIESYEAALAKDRQNDTSVLACLGRAWLLKGRQERNLTAMKNSLDYSKRALELSPEQIHFKFNVAFAQNQIAQLVQQTDVSKRTLEDVIFAKEGLDAAIGALHEIAKAPQPPYPRHDIEQRANLGGTMRKQLERAEQSQREYEESNADRLQKAREARDKEMKQKEEEARKVEEARQEMRRKQEEDRREMAEKARIIAEQRAADAEAEADRRRDLDEDREVLDEDGNVIRVKRGRRGEKRKKPAKSADIVSDNDSEVEREERAGLGSNEDDEITPLNSDVEGATKSSKPRKKKRKLERKKPEKKSKFKSDERIIDSDEDLFDDDEPAAAKSDDGDEQMADGDNDQPVVAPRKSKRVIDDEDDEDEGVAQTNGAGSDDE